MNLTNTLLKVGCKKYYFRTKFYSELSKSTYSVDNKVNFELLNKKFLYAIYIFTEYIRDLKIPYKCLLESEKTLLKIVGKSYFYVPFECGVIEPDNKETWKVLEGKSHNNV